VVQRNLPGIILTCCITQGLGSRGISLRNTFLQGLYQRFDLLFQDWVSGVSAFNRMCHILVGSREDIARPRGVLFEKQGHRATDTFSTHTILLLFEKSSHTYSFSRAEKVTIVFCAIPRSETVVQSVSFDLHDV